MWKLGLVGAAALSLALAVATPAFAQGHRGGGATYVGSGSSVTQARAGSVVLNADAAYCRARWPAYDSTSGEYMDDEGRWWPCR
jgi:hypothetical protein